MSKLRIAVIYDDDSIYVEIKPSEFKKLLVEYYTKHKDIIKAVESIEFDLKQKTRYT